ncbi:MAG: phosphoglucosamine mutase [Armatimonadetes bacterium]|nr:phosphoglucosamine mutase [Armatimonadota bacterium]
MVGRLIVSISGVRGIVGKTLTSDVALRWALAYGTMLKSEKENVTIAVGMDTRPSGKMFKCATIAGVLSTGCNVVDLGIVPTPTLQLYIREHTDGGIGITASHNPEEWNAFKFFRANGMYVDRDRINVLKELVESASFIQACWDDVGMYWTDEATTMHVERIASLIDVNEIRRRRFKVAIDCVNSAASTVAIPLLERLGCDIVPLNCSLNGKFTRPPEPTPESLQELAIVVRNSGADVGFGFDADADRVVIVADGGIPLSEEMTLCVATEHVLSMRSGIVVTNISTSMAIEDIAKAYGCEVIRTPVGDLNVSAKLMEVGGVIGGEGNGGIIYPPLQYARDGLCGMALILEFMAKRNEALSQLITKFPQYCMIKRKLEGTHVGGVGEIKRRIECLIQTADQVIDADGIKLIWHAPKRWLHLRQSGTENVIRIIAEAEDKHSAKELCDTAERLLIA